MRKMDYCRYDSPTYTGEINKELEAFYLDYPLENGIYKVIIIDPADEDVYTLDITIKDNLYTYDIFWSSLSASIAHITFPSDVRNHVYVDKGSLSPGSTIELYKLN